MIPKTTLRKKFQAEFASRGHADAALMHRHLHHLLTPLKRGRLMAYQPFDSEVPILDIVPGGWEVYTPQIRGSGLIARKGRTTRPISQMHVLVVPGLWVTANGDRLGRGGGFYDRLLRFFPRERAIFVCSAWQVCASLPVEPCDRRVGAVVTELGYRRCYFESGRAPESR